MKYTLKSSVSTALLTFAMSFAAHNAWADPPPDAQWTAKFTVKVTSNSQGVVPVTVDRGADWLGQEVQVDTSNLAFTATFASAFDEAPFCNLKVTLGSITFLQGDIYDGSDIITTTGMNIPATLTQGVPPGTYTFALSCSVN